MMRLDKEQVAVRQLDTAIRLFFSEGDAVSVHTLACAAAEVLHTILQTQGHYSWHNEIIKEYPGMENEVRQMLRRARNFFKHADKDTEEVLDFDEEDNDQVILLAILEYDELLSAGAPSGRTENTIPMSVFQLWYIAKNSLVLEERPGEGGIEASRRARSLFPDLAGVTRAQQLAKGAEMLKHWE
jgi:hypothetical protein